ncbi:1-hydroxy-2-methyl-2-(E)-butenyl 4-diphosphate synthase [Thermanaerovibrio velox DSM 12556]|uniref:4-hydroxy-3-methylbut-2-en-1-yl diphosphate synthase (flavodoxin) n=2 Tax=Thermanaerovibrio TaxID=81461 RepID=H0URX0_9BACT|nr:1-hydroxy-2-methyl-2-(E)-butenyl 4-diphosphate synthase [Thermanaerovibrio velox DSM 12556]
MGSIRSVSIGGLSIGGGSPVRVESMLKTPLEDIDGCINELHGLKVAGCELVRTSYRDLKQETSLKEVVNSSPIPIMADIHFDHRLALSAMIAGCLSVRVNPGNLGGEDRMMKVLAAARDANVVIRVGANGGSLSNDQIARADGDRAKALVLAVREQVDLCLQNGFEDVIVSAKSSDVKETMRANHMLASIYDLPFHIGITEAGPPFEGAIKSAVGIGGLLMSGIGDTIRVSLSGDGVLEVKAAYQILRSLGIRSKGVEWISCPTCGRCRMDSKVYVDKVRKIFDGIDDVPDGFKVAVMGCEVNGPREAAGADLGIAGAPSGFIVFARGKSLGSWPLEMMESVIPEILREVLSRAGDTHLP